MKSLLCFLVPLWTIGIAVAQPSSYSLSNNPKTTPSNLKTATTINDISPLVWRYMGLQAKDRFELDNLRKLDSVQGYYIQPPQNNFPNIVNVIRTEVSAVSNGNKQLAVSGSQELSIEQKQLLTTADLSSNIELTVCFRLKNEGPEKPIKVGRVAIAVVPEQEAQYRTGEFDEVASYLSNYVAAHYTSPTLEKLMKRISLVFTVTEDGSLTNIKIRYTTEDTKVDKLLIEAAQQMPKWKPARDAKGIPVRQTIYFTRSGC